MAAPGEKTRDRLKSAAAAALFHGLIGYAFLTGLGFDLVSEAPDQLKLFDVTEAPPPPAAEPPAEIDESDNRKTKDPEGAAAPPNKKDTPAPVVAPPPEIRIERPPPVVAAPAPAEGWAFDAGAAKIDGPGTGRGGEGTGLGSGLHGTGTGGGGGGRPRRAVLIRGGIYDRDYPPAALARGAQGVVFMRFVVAPNGRVRDCRITRSSGDRALDETTCRLIRERFIYRPASDAGGRPVPDTIIGEHLWELGPPGPDAY